MAMAGLMLRRAVSRVAASPVSWSPLLSDYAKRLASTSPMSPEAMVEALKRGDLQAVKDALPAAQRQRVPSGADQAALGAPADLETLLKQQAEAQVVMAEQLKAVEETEEWQEYKGEVEFELDVLRSRYSQSGEPMTPQRTAQFQAHHRKLQMTIMERAAEKAANKLFLSMTSKERDKMRREFQELEATGMSLDEDDAMELQPFQTSELDAGMSNLRLALLTKAFEEGRITKEELDRQRAAEQEGVAASRLKDPERRRMHEEAVAAVGKGAPTMPSIAASASKEVKEKASIEDRLLAMRAKVRDQEMQELSAQVERQRALDRAEGVIEKQQTARGAKDTELGSESNSDSDVEASER